MSDSRIGAQLYTLREFTKTPADIAKTMKKVREIGYEAVQVSGMGPIDPKELKKIVDGEGITVAATHIGFDRMRDQPEAVIEEHQLWGCRHPAIGGLPADYRNAEGFHKFAKEASAVAKRLAEGGLTFSYHNHSFELERFGDKTGLEILRTESDPKYFDLEIDTYWIQHGGGDPAEWVMKCKGRIPLLHLKDMSNKAGQPLMTEVGEGNLNWPRILDAAKEAGVEWYLIEQDICQRDPFESLAISLRNLQSMGIK
ncbi:MAG TPA: sugar phosphate isomerase/epimerase [Armatimonadota bacterium]|nr:sugar phosphate isomerase/epimerase [Armatimonadota bacterium]